MLAKGWKVVRALSAASSLSKTRIWALISSEVCFLGGIVMVLGGWVYRQGVCIAGIGGCYKEKEWEAEEIALRMRGVVSTKNNERGSRLASLSASRRTTGFGMKLYR